MALADEGLVSSATDISDGGIAVALAQASFRNSIGATVGIIPIADAPASLALFGEQATQVILTCSPANKEKIEDLIFGYPDLSCWQIGETIAGRLHITASEGTATDAAGVASRVLIDCAIDDLRKPWANALEAALHDEVTA